MADIINIARTGLSASNAGLQTTGHNIANVNSEGYHKQRLELAATGPVRFGANRYGLGVNINDVTRMQDEILLRQRRDVQSEATSFNQIEQIGTQISEMFGESGYHLDEAIGDYFNAVRQSVDDPKSIPLRTVLLQRAEEMTNRFSSLDDRLARMETDMAPQMALEVKEINALSEELAYLNGQMSTGFSNDNDMLDRRDVLLDKLAAKIQIDTRINGNGQVSVSIGKGQTIVQDISVTKLRTESDPKNPELLRVVFDNGGAGTDITGAIQGGTLGGILTESRSLLRDTREGLGQLAASLVTEINAVHRQSIDIDGNPGSDFFDPITPKTISDSGNTGSALMQTVVVDGTALQSKSYALSYDGTDWDVSDGKGQSLITGASLPINIDGVEISLSSGTLSAGDEFSVSPSLGAASRMNLALDNTRGIAYAQPVRASEASDNNGSTVVQDISVVDYGNAALQSPVMVEFADPPTQYSLIDPSNGAVLAAPAAYTSGATIAFNGWELTLTGSPVAGDRVTVEGNSDGLASQNLDRIAKLQTEKIMAGGNASIEEMYTALVGDVGSRVNSAVNNAEAQAQVHHILSNRLQNTVGVSLDEEATRMLQYQQMFQASARIVQTAQATFDSIMQSI